MEPLALVDVHMACFTEDYRFLGTQGQTGVTPMLCSWGSPGPSEGQLPWDVGRGTEKKCASGSALARFPTLVLEARGAPLEKAKGVAVPDS